MRISLGGDDRRLDEGWKGVLVVVDVDACVVVEDGRKVLPGSGVVLLAIESGRVGLKVDGFELEVEVFDSEFEVDPEAEAEGVVEVGRSNESKSTPSKNSTSSKSSPPMPIFTFPSPNLSFLSTSRSATDFAFLLVLDPSPT